MSVGIEAFFTKAKGATADEAFKIAVEKAQYDYGHAGYTGTIAEKTEFKHIEPPESWASSPEKYAEKIMDCGFSHEWGPAGCVKIAADEWLFFGWAPSGR